MQHGTTATDVLDLKIEKTEISLKTHNTILLFTPTLILSTTQRCGTHNKALPLPCKVFNFFSLIRLNAKNLTLLMCSCGTSLLMFGHDLRIFLSKLWSQYMERSASSSALYNAIHALHDLTRTFRIFSVCIQWSMVTIDSISTNCHHFFGFRILSILEAVSIQPLISYGVSMDACNSDAYHTNYSDDKHISIRNTQCIKHAKR